MAVEPQGPFGDDDGALSAQAVSMRFSGLHALREVTLRVGPGDILGLIGPNGSGKTTLINVVTGLLRPTGGRVRLAGTDITGLPAHRIGRLGVARTFQVVRLFRDLTVRENVEVAAVASGAPRHTARRLAAELLEEVGAGHLGRRFAGELPYGHERLVEIARALASAPRFLVLDEPAAGMDEDEGERLLELLRRLPGERGLGMVVVDHDMHLMMRLSHRLHVLASGATIGEGTPEEVRGMPAVVEAYLGSHRGDGDGAAA